MDGWKEEDGWMDGWRVLKESDAGLTRLKSSLTMPLCS